jgi:hypothetical protein
MLQMDIIYINHTECFSDVLFQYPTIVPDVLSVCIDLKQLLLCCRSISNVYMKIETSHAFYNLVN